MRGCYLGIRGLDSCFGNALFKRAAADQEFIDTLEAHLKGTRRMALFRAWGLIDYGRSLLRVAAISFGLAAIYGVIYRIFPQILDYKDSANTWFTPYYFSIVTYTTLGFGDVRPASLAGEIIVSSKVILGYTTLGLLLPRPRAKHRAPRLRSQWLHCCCTSFADAPFRGLVRMRWEFSIVRRSLCPLHRSRLRKNKFEPGSWDASLHFDGAAFDGSHSSAPTRRR